MHYLALSLSKLHIGLINLLIVALNGPLEDFQRLVVALSVMNHRVLRLVEFDAGFVPALQDRQVWLARCLRVNVLFSYLRPECHMFSLSYSACIACSLD